MNSSRVKYTTTQVIAAPRRSIHSLHSALFVCLFYPTLDNISSRDIFLSPTLPTTRTRLWLFVSIIVVYADQLIKLTLMTLKD